MRWRPVRFGRGVRKRLFRPALLLADQPLGGALPHAERAKRRASAEPSRWSRRTVDPGPAGERPWSIPIRSRIRHGRSCCGSPRPASSTRRHGCAALRETYGFAARACLASNADGEAQGGVAYCDGERCCSAAAFCRCRSRTPAIRCWHRAGLAGAVRRRCKPQACRCTCAASTMPAPAADRQLSVAKRARWHTLAVNSDPDAVWARFRGRTRRAIRKAERAGVGGRGR